MACYHPQTVYRSKSGRNPETGLWPVVFNPKEGYHDLSLQIPCGRCIACRLEKSRQWAIRCVHEAKMHESNMFITLTYNEDNERKSLVKEDFVLFMKRYRKECGNGIRYFHCGEYGENFDRPHHHACIFGHRFDDLTHWSTRNGIPLYRSLTLEKLWRNPKTKESYGFSTVGDVNWESAAYVARYVTKKITGGRAESHYAGRQPEYVSMSLKPGIGRPFYDKFGDDMYNADQCVVREGLICKPARYYDKIYDKEQPMRMAHIKGIRKEEGKFYAQDYESLERSEKLKIYQQNRIRRSYESDVRRFKENCDYFK